MIDPRFRKFAQTLVNYSVNVQPGEHVLIDALEVDQGMLVALVNQVYERGGHPHVWLKYPRVTAALLKGAKAEGLEVLSKNELQMMKQMDAYIALRGMSNIFEQDGISAEQTSAAMKAFKPVIQQRIKKTKWVALRWPTPEMAQQAKMSTEAFFDYYFKVATMDYSKLKPGMEALRKLMDKTKEVHIVGPGTDLRFSIEDIPTVSWVGNKNIPDGEVFTAPVKKSVEGVISYNAPSIYAGISFNDVRLEFKKGKVVKATSSNNELALNHILNADAGASYIGEFALGVNPLIDHPIQDILFDEKIHGSLHFTPGQCYEETENGNRSKIHWDLVLIQRKDYGGGDIYFDGKLIRKDGDFVPESLQRLNRKELIKHF